MTYKMIEPYDIYYDPEADFLEIIFEAPPNDSHAEEIEPGIFLSKDEETDKIFAVGILSFKKRPRILDEILKKININFPLNIGVK